MLCHGKYLLSAAFLIQPSEFDPAFYQAVRNSENERVTRHFSHPFSHALVRARLPLLRSCGIPMASSQALQPRAVACSGTSGSLYEHDFFCSPPPCTSSSCLPPDVTPPKTCEGQMEAKAEANGREEESGWRVDANGMRLLMGFVRWKTQRSRRWG